MSVEHASPSALPPVRRPRVRLALLIGLAAFAAVVVAGVGTRVVEGRALEQWTQARAVPSVALAAADLGQAEAPLELPGRLEAQVHAPIYARTSGYLKRWSKDIGATVKAGELLAEIETPDLDQQLLQARADLASAKASAALAATTAKRWQGLQGSDSVARQEVDEKVGDYATKQALAKAAQANVDRILALKAYARILAPFDGTLTARNTDVGALINAGSDGAALFEVSDTRKLRVYVRVPQAFAPLIRPGDSARLTVPEYAGRSFPAKVEADARKIAAGSGSTLVQLLVDNQDGSLLPGGYASVAFDLSRDARGRRLPASALIFDSRGMRVATVDAKDQVRFKTVSIRRDFGASVEIGSGLEADARVISSPPDGLLEGDPVRIAGAADGAPKP
ncbi:efflux RND transporter periplasmic adaptor subunit [Pseudomonas citronellolis]|uniref:efflux RND transporter periplasmic adaptor subunit n=1 Tax=Pseudomonas citronellolis TaxID=53408 RepID=UPI0023E3EF82|nr:efflux RND transporter periplasmic adaptor subunit [Pseudomonas citronellolis]MDF3932900.1 efflux RND transporter periplasmic adaptor subunit [Pseudomonas citronellolis]